MYRRYPHILLLILALLLGGCSSDESSSQGERDAPTPVEETTESTDTSVRADGLFRIVATTTQAADLAQILTQGIADIEIIALMGAGVDPHLYQPTESDVAAMNVADMIIYSGLHLEGQFDVVFEALQEQGGLIYSLSQPVKEAGFIIGAFDSEAAQLGSDDPHFWFDPRNWEVTTTDLAETFAEMDPENSDAYLASAEAYVAQLRELYTWAVAGMASVPDGQRYLVTSHDAFQYFGAAFGWQMAAIQGISTADEAGVGDIQGTVNFVIENEIPVLLVESSIPPDTIEAVLAAIADEGGETRLGVRELYSDAMGTPGTPGGTYIGMLAANVYTILQSYQCAGAEASIPAWPDNVSPAPSEDLLTIDCG